MSNKLKLLIDLFAYSTVAPTNDPSDDSIKIKKLIEESSFSEIQRQLISVADEITDQTINLADATCEYLIILADQDISVKINGSSTSMTLKVKSAGTKIPVFFMRGTITAVTVSNASGEIANLDVITINL